MDLYDDWLRMGLSMILQLFLWIRPHGRTYPLIMCRTLYGSNSLARVNQTKKADYLTSFVWYTRGKLVARATRSRCARSKLLRASSWRPTYFVGSRMLPHATNKKARHGDGLFYLFSRVYEIRKIYMRKCVV